ncbi:MAG: hypothetical protein QXG03_02750 [Halalkalicoccus sp.]
MRRAKRLALLAIALSVLLLLALGALPQHLGGGETYVMTATEIEQERPAVDASEIDERRYPYMSEALETGTSEPYEDDRFGIKEPFTHTPFDELGAVEQLESEAVDGETAYVADNGTLYRVEITEAV